MIKFPFVHVSSSMLFAACVLQGEFARFPCLGSCLQCYLQVSESNQSRCEFLDVIVNPLPLMPPSHHPLTLRTHGSVPNMSGYYLGTIDH